MSATSLHAYPNYLSYANELWGGPGEAYRYLANSDVDWGQAQKMARDYIAKTHPANCFFLRTYNNKNSDYDIPCAGISEIQWDQLQTPYTGTMIVSSSMVDGIGVRGASVQTYRMFRRLNPAAKLAGSALLVYEGTIDVSPIVAAQLLLQAREIGEQDPQQALELAQKAAALDPHERRRTCRHLRRLPCAWRSREGPAGVRHRDSRWFARIRSTVPSRSSILKDFILRNGLQIHSSQMKLSVSSPAYRLSSTEDPDA